MKPFAALLIFVTSCLAADIAQRPPAAPLIACDPYFSIWSTSDHLNDEVTKHWTGTAQPLSSVIRIDGASFRLMGRDPREIAGLPQTAVDVEPTRTLYDFEGQGVHVRMTFLSPVLPDLESISKPITYITWDVRSLDKSHDVQIYFDASASISVNTGDQEVTASRFQLGNQTVLRVGSQQQPVLERSGDNLRIDWGFLYTASPDLPAATAIAAQKTAADSFLKTGTLPLSDDLNLPRPAQQDRPVLAYAFNLGTVNSGAAVSRHVVLAYDDLFSIEYFYRRLRPYWRRNGAEASDLVLGAIRDFDAVSKKARAFDDKLMEDLRRAGGDDYARIGALAYRQAFAAQKLAADLDGTPLLFPKENFSNGCIATVDVIYPASPILLLFNTDLLKASLTPVLDYAMMPRWRFPFAPHDLGTYPKANGQVYGGGEKSDENQMPVEESGNMLIMLAAISKLDGNTNYAGKYLPAVRKWAEYLKEKGLDPENQLCTDDFAGHLAHNANLSLKAIVALAAYANLAPKDEAADYRKLAKQYAAQWMKLADDGDHYKLTFDRPGTWSQKYNLVWDKLLGLKLFPASVAKKEIAYYLAHQNQYGLPLDSRKDYTKLDWLVWTATLADNKADFEAFLRPAARFAQESPSRVPLTDWYNTKTAKQEGFQARSVVGGVFIKLLAR